MLAYGGKKAKAPSQLPASPLPAHGPWTRNPLVGAGGQKCSAASPPNSYMSKRCGVFFVCGVWIFVLVWFGFFLRGG